MSTIKLKVKGTGYGGLPSGRSSEIVAERQGNTIDRVYYRSYGAFAIGNNYEVRVAYLNDRVREDLSAFVGFASEDECRTSPYFLVGRD
jgi:hypothetical protein